MRLFSLLFAFAILLHFAAPAFAEGPDLVAFSAGEYDVFDDNKAAEFVVEYRMKSPLVWKIAPLAGVMVTTDAAVYGFAGLGADFFLTDRVVLNPNFAVGAYHDGSGKDLGHTVEFRSGVELGYQFDNYSRLGIAFNHISNASLGDSNPGTESLLLTYAVPISKITGR